MSEEKGFHKLETAGFDSRFPNQNQTKNCWNNYVDFFKCQKVLGEDDLLCFKFRKAYHSLCPLKWIERWDEQRENNLFPPLRQEEETHH